MCEEVLIADLNVVECEWLRVSEGGTEGGYGYGIGHFRWNDLDSPYLLVDGSPITLHVTM